MIPDHVRRIHESALIVSKEFRVCESRLVQAIGEADAQEVFRHYGFPSLFKYAVEALGLTESIAYALIQVTRTAKYVPELRKEVEEGTLSVFKAKKICAVLKSSSPAENQLWIEKAKSLTSRELESEVLQVKSPCLHLLKLQIGMGLRAQLERCQDLVSQSAARAVTLEETLEALVAEFLKRKDPLEKAKRMEKIPDQANQQQVPGPVESDRVAQLPRVSPGPLSGGSLPTTEIANSKRAPFRIRVHSPPRHQVAIRDGRQCAHVDSDGKRCRERRFLHIHHIQPVSKGGSNDPSNLKTLCSAHHRLLHWAERQSQLVEMQEV